MQNPWGRAKCQIREKVKEHSEKRIELLFWTMAILNSKIEEMNKKYQSDLQSQTSEVRQGGDSAPSRQKETGGGEKKQNKKKLP